MTSEPPTTSLTPVSCGVRSTTKVIHDAALIWDRKIPLILSGGLWNVQLNGMLHHSAMHVSNGLWLPETCFVSKRCGQRLTYLRGDRFAVARPEHEVLHSHGRRVAGALRRAFSQPGALPCACKAAEGTHGDNAPVSDTAVICVMHLWIQNIWYRQPKFVGVSRKIIHSGSDWTPICCDSQNREDKNKHQCQLVLFIQGDCG